MDHLNHQSSFEQTTVYQIASTWIKPEDDPAVFAWLQSLTQPDPEYRREVVNQLAQRRDEQVRVPLMVALSDTDSRVRSIAAHALVFNHDKRAVKPLIAVLRNPETRSSASLVLGLLCDRGALEPLLTIFQEEVARHRSEAVVRGALLVPTHDLNMMIGALARLGDPGAVEPLIATLPDTSWYMQDKVARALAQLHDRRAVEPLLAVLQGIVAHVSRSALREPRKKLSGLPEGLFWALGVFGMRQAVEPLLALLTYPNLRPWDRKKVIDVLGQLGDVRAVELLCSMLKEQPLAPRLAAARALGLLGDRRAVEALSVALTARSGHLRAAAARSLGQIGDVRAVGSLLTAMQDSRITVRQASAGALGKIGDTRAVEPLTAALHDPDARVRVTVRKALDRLGPHAVETS